MKVSIIIPAFNEEKLLPQTLASVRSAALAFTDRGWQVQVIVCDNNSSDNTAQVARDGGAEVVFEPVNQISRARNAGAAAATGDWLVFVDADSHPSRELFDETARLMAAGAYIGGGAVVQCDSTFGMVSFALRGWNLLSRSLRWMAGSYIFCEAGAFRELEGFSRELYVSEEIDFSARLKKLAKKRHKKVGIISRQPIRTSDRKLHLYGRWEHVKFFWRFMTSGWRHFKRRENCHIWYDGRR